MSNTSPLVLVADDEPQMLELVARHLKTFVNPRLDVIEASDGEQAWRLAQERLPDLVVLDVMMPGMSGWEVCRKIRENVALAHTGVVMLTGIGENLNQMTSPLYGADAYIDKPFEFGDLDRKVRDTLDSRAAMRGTVGRPKMNGVGGAAKPKPAKTTAKPSVKKAGPAKAASKKIASKKAPAKKAGGAKKVAVKAAAKSKSKAAAKQAKSVKAKKKTAKRR
jgi:DNA-binding response OmpR family regulator